jgi:DNA-directed RNA polymerase specialized sigma24 family protein
LDSGVDSGGEKYLEMRRRLADYFARRQCAAADDLADETLNRVARRLSEEPGITDTPPGRYCYITAKFVFLEHLRRATPDSNVTPPGDGEMLSSLAAPAAPNADVRQRLLDCLDRCLETLAPRDRELILEYYRGDERARIEHRRALAARLGLTLNAVSIRACRIRDTLEACVRSCQAEE